MPVVDAEDTLLELCVRFELSTAAEVKVIERTESYMQVALSDGRRGWLRSEVVGLVQPLPESRD